MRRQLIDTFHLEHSTAAPTSIVFSLVPYLFDVDSTLIPGGVPSALSGYATRMLYSITLTVAGTAKLHRLQKGSGQRHESETTWFVRIPGPGPVVFPDVGNPQTATANVEVQPVNLLHSCTAMTVRESYAPNRGRRVIEALFIGHSACPLPYAKISPFMFNPLSDLRANSISFLPFLS